MRPYFCLLALPLLAQVPYERIRRAELERGQWLTHSGNYSAHRYSPLAQINTANVAQLKVKWMYQLNRTARFETTPLVADGVMYLTEPATVVTALDLRSGRVLWKYERQIPKDLQTLGFGRVNRGVALLDGMVYVGTLDAHLVALDAKTGAVRWDSEVADYKTGHCITSAPLAIDGKIITGISGGEAGIRGFLDAYDAKTGQRAWRFWTIPGPGEPGNDTWAGDSWKTGGAPTWVTGSYDPELDLVYWGTGNPAPDWNGDKRLGDNLYSCSLIALEGKTGKLRWHFQYTPHDTHDWDANEIPVLTDLVVRGKLRKVVVMANRNAFYYVNDRATGEFLVGRQYVKQTWAKGLDDRGRPIVIPGTDPTEEGVLVWPSLNGATNWYSPSYNPVTRQFFVAAREKGSIYVKAEAEYKPGTLFMGGGEKEIDPDEISGAIRALDAATGAKQWEFPLKSPPWAGVMATAGGLVFGGSNEGNFFALDAKSGKPLWDFQTGSDIAANPISFLIDGKQHVAIPSGSVLLVFGL